MSTMNATSRAVFISYASQDAAAANRICETLRAASIEVWFDQSELRGGDAWDQKIRCEIRECALFIPLISANTATRPEGYFRLEWSLAEARSQMIARNKPFIVPVCLDQTPEFGADVPDSFQRVQWTRLPGGNTPPAFTARISTLLGTVPNTGVTTDSARPTAGGRAATAKPTPQMGYAVMALATLVIVGLAFVAFDRFRVSKPTPADRRIVALAPAPAVPAIPEKSVAVLPFVDMSEKKDQEYFSDGLSEELIDLLTKVPDLHVPARTSSFYFKGQPQDIQTIAHKLLVTHVLEGSVRRSGNHLRVTAQLIRADNGYHLWSETYDRNVDDIFKVQDYIAGAVVKALKVSLLQSEAPRAAPTTNSEAYRLYLQAVSLARQESSGDDAQAYVYLRRALKLDPQFALAWAALAENYTHDSGDWDTVFSSANALEARTARDNSQAASTTDKRSKIAAPGTSWQSVAKIVVTGSHDAVERALTLGPNLPETHLAAARVHLYVDWDWAGAEREINKARELDPRNARVTQLAASWAITVGRLQQAIDLAQKALTQDPLGTANFELGKANHRIGKLGDAENAYRQLLALYPNSDGAHYRYGLLLLEMGRPEAALDEINHDIPQYRQTGLPLALDALGRRADADRELALAEKQWGSGMACQIAYVYASRNNADQAINSLVRAYDQHDDGLLSMLHDPFLRNIERDPRFTALLRKMNLHE